MMGSHIDTVATGGRYDGNLGVLAGLEVIESVLASGRVPARPLSVAYFTDEEGSRFAPDMLGSLAYVGGMALEEALEITDRDGIAVGDELDRIGYRGPAPVPGTVPYAYMELHIEQGPVLEFHETQIGVVEGVQGISWTEVTLSGQSNHAGTTTDAAAARRRARRLPHRRRGARSGAQHRRFAGRHGRLHLAGAEPRQCHRRLGGDDGRLAQHLRTDAAARGGSPRRDRQPHRRGRASRCLDAAHGPLRACGVPTLQSST